MPVESPTRSASKTIPSTRATTATPSRALRDTGHCRPRVQCLSCGIHRQMQSCPFLLGQLRLCVTRFSGRRAPDVRVRIAITQRSVLARSEQRRLLAGNGDIAEAAFYAYTAPEPAGLRDRPCGRKPPLSRALGEFLLMYDDVRRRARRALRCASSANRPMRRAPISRSGTARHSNASKMRRPPITRTSRWQPPAPTSIP